MHGTITAAAMPMWPDDSTCNTIYGVTMAAATPMQCNNSTYDTMCRVHPFLTLYHHHPLSGMGYFPPFALV